MAGFMSSIKKWINNLAEDNKKTFGSNANLDCCNLPGKKAGAGKNSKEADTAFYSAEDAELMQYQMEYSSTIQEQGLAKTYTAEISGMSCNNCVKHVKEAIISLKGVIQSEVKIGSAKITAEEGLDKESIEKAIKSAGYSAKVYAQ